MLAAGGVGAWQGSCCRLTAACPCWLLRASCLSSLLASCSTCLLHCCCRGRCCRLCCCLVCQEPAYMPLVESARQPMLPQIIWSRFAHPARAPPAAATPPAAPLRKRRDAVPPLVELITAGAALDGALPSPPPTLQCCLQPSLNVPCPLPLAADGCAAAKPGLQPLLLPSMLPVLLPRTLRQQQAACQTPRVCRHQNFQLQAGCQQQQGGHHLAALRSLTTGPLVAALLCLLPPAHGAGN